MKKTYVHCQVTPPPHIFKIQEYIYVMLLYAYKDGIQMNS